MRLPDSKAVAMAPSWTRNFSINVCFRQLPIFTQTKLPVLPGERARK